jgi:chromate transporter
MLKLYFLLFIEFSKIGVFAIGGGYAALPFLFYLQSQYNWFTVDELTNMIAVSNITPGPVGINMATYTGYTTAGLTGSLIATVSILLIPFIITIVISKLFSKVQNNNTVKNVFVGLRAAACALLISIGIKLLYKDIIIDFQTNNINYSSLILFVILIIPFSFMKKNPLWIILAGALGGIIIKAF